MYYLLYTVIVDAMHHDIYTGNFYMNCENKTERKTYRNNSPFRESFLLPETCAHLTRTRSIKKYNVQEEQRCPRFNELDKNAIIFKLVPGNP